MTMKMTREKNDENQKKEAKYFKLMHAQLTDIAALSLPIEAADN